jgi:hypothetical protein
MRPPPAHAHTRSRARRRVARGSTVALAAVAAGSAAWASWTTYGAGTGSAATGSLSVLTLSPGTPVAQLYPGGSAGVVLTITNPSAASVHIGSLILDDSRGTGGLAVDAGHRGCDLSSLTFATATNDALGWSVPGASDGAPGAVTTTLAGALSMGLDAVDDCQSAVVTVYLTAGP